MFIEVCALPIFCVCSRKMKERFSPKGYPGEAFQSFSCLNFFILVSASSLVQFFCEKSKHGFKSMLGLSLVVFELRQKAIILLDLFDSVHQCAPKMWWRGGFFSGRESENQVCFICMCVSFLHSCFNFTLQCLFSPALLLIHWRLYYFLFLSWK